MKANKHSKLQSSLAFFSQRCFRRSEDNTTLKFHLAGPCLEASESHGVVSMPGVDLHFWMGFIQRDQALHAKWHWIVTAPEHDSRAEPLLIEMILDMGN